MRWPRGVRARLAGALVLLVAVTAVVLGVGASVFVDARLHQQALQDAAAQATFDLTVTVPGRQLPDEPTRRRHRSQRSHRYVPPTRRRLRHRPGRRREREVERHPGRSPFAAAARRPAAGRSWRARLRLAGRRRQAVARGRRAGAGWRAGGVLRPRRRRTSLARWDSSAACSSWARSCSWSWRC